MDAVQIAVFVAYVGAHAQAVLFCRGNQAQLVQLEKATYFGETVAFLAADFYREHHVLIVAKTKRHQGVRNGRAAPVRQRHIHGLQRIQRVAAGLPAGREVGAAAPLEVAHVVQRDLIAVDLAVRLPRDFRYPRAVV
ncbi:hypothetical protein D3C71_1756090 [compost metagenome]